MIKVHYKYTDEVFKTLVHNEINELNPTSGKIMHNVSRLDGYKNPKVYKFTVDKIFEDKESYLEEYGNLLSEVNTERTTIVVETEGDKVRLSFYYMNNFRKVGKRYFTKQIIRRYLTYNLKTNNFYITKVSKPIGSRMYRKVTCNDFKGVESFMGDVESYFKTKDTTFLNTFINLVNSENSYDGEVTNFEKNLIEAFIKRNGIKGPNHMTSMIKYGYLGKRVLKKYGYNLIHSILGHMGIKSKYFIRLFNLYSVDMNYLSFYVKILGLKYVRTIDMEFFKYEHSPYFYMYDKVKKIDFDAAERLYSYVEDYERKNIVKVINDFTKSRHHNKVVSGRYSSRNITGLIQDHMEIIRKLKKYDNTIKFRATTINQFDEEHLSYSSLYGMYQKSEDIFYLYDKELIKSIGDSPKGCEFVLLKDSNDYIEESTKQSNCVRTYIDKFSSIIISVRSGNERVTTEFNYDGKCIQKRGRFNENPSEKMLDYIDVLEDKIHQLKMEGKLQYPNIKIHNKMTKQDTHYTHEELVKSNFRVLNNNIFTEFDDFLDIEYDDLLM